MQEPDDLGYRCRGQPTLGANGRFFHIGGIYLIGLHWIFGGSTHWESRGILLWLKVHFICHLKSTTINLFCAFFFFLVMVEPVKQQLWACYWWEARATVRRPPPLLIIYLKRKKKSTFVGPVIHQHKSYVWFITIGKRMFLSKHSAQQIFLIF